MWSSFEIPAEFAVEIDARFLPLTLHSSLREILHRGNLGEGEAAEKLHVDDLCQRWIDFSQLIEGRAKLLEFEGVCRLLDCSDGGRNVELAAAFLCALAASVIDDEAAHHAGGISHEAGTIRELCAATARNLDVSLVKERCCANAHRHLMRKLAPRQPMQFVIESSEEVVGDGAIAAFGRFEER